ncbi:hypothetical protein HID58_075487 [Brassica napus]|uniref:F-box associated beta-propeller type 3 domain-containing protein n=1 Tax=Brassica napus TaxID=3708 RepID=A0ABQ7YJS9_BRANA|nr:hypothetical protein HID58_075487 [Brassica napus]
MVKAKKIMGEEEENPNQIYITTDVVEEILVRLPFKTVSREWRSLMESRRFADRRMSVPKNRKFLAVGNQAQSRFQGDEEIEMVYLKCDEATRPSLTCDGVVCIPEPNWVSVLNPSTGEFNRLAAPSTMRTTLWWSEFNINSAMGFGKDEVTGNYKVVSMLFDHNHYQILDVDIGQWRKLVPPPYKVDTRRKSACVERIHLLILAFDLHTEEFRDVQVLPPSLHSTAARLVNLDDRLAIADICMMKPGWNLEIWIMDAQEETWSMTYSITLAHRFIPMHRRVIEEWSTMFTPLAVSKEGSLFFYDTKKRLFKYEPETDFLCCLSSDICVISPFVENLVRLHTGCVPKTRPPGCRNGRSCLNLVPGSRISKQIKLQIPNILLTSTLISYLKSVGLVCFHPTVMISNLLTLTSTLISYLKSYLKSRLMSRQALVHYRHQLMGSTPKLTIKYNRDSSLPVLVSFHLRPEPYLSLIVIGNFFNINCH